MRDRAMRMLPRRRHFAERIAAARHRAGQDDIHAWPMLLAAHAHEPAEIGLSGRRRRSDTRRSEISRADARGSADDAPARMRA